MLRAVRQNSNIFDLELSLQDHSNDLELSLQSSNHKQLFCQIRTPMVKKMKENFAFRGVDIYLTLTFDSKVISATRDTHTV